MNIITKKVTGPNTLYKSVFFKARALNLREILKCVQQITCINSKFHLHQAKLNFLHELSVLANRVNWTHSPYTHAVVKTWIFSRNNEFLCSWEFLFFFDLRILKLELGRSAFTTVAQLNAIIFTLSHYHHPRAIYTENHGWLWVAWCGLMKPRIWFKLYLKSFLTRAQTGWESNSYLQVRMDYDLGTFKLAPSRIHIIQDQTPLQKTEQTACLLFRCWSESNGSRWSIFHRESALA